jgi:hypothetical protein
MGFLLAGCGMPLSHETRYVGTATPEAACGAASPATLTTAKGRFTLAPDDGTLLLSGDVGADGALLATLTTPGADRKPFVMRFNGRMNAQTVQGRYVTPRCAFAVSLTAK